LKIKPKNIIAHELIGLKVKIYDTHNKYLGSGTVIDETRNLIRVMVNNSIKNFLKNSCYFHFILPDKKTVKINGQDLIGRPEERLKWL
jgi:ribonuclease P protein subunit POP4